MFYLTIKFIHLLCACIVVGYLVYDVFIFSSLKKKLGEVEFMQLKRRLLKLSGLVLGLGFLFLLISGGILASFHLSLDFSQNFSSQIQKLILLKIALVALLFVFTLISFYFILVLKRPDPFRKYYHHLALVICLLALIIAKLLFL